MGEKMDIGFGLGTLELNDDPWENILGAVGDGLDAFFRTYTLNQQAKAEMAFKQEELAYKVQKAQQDSEYRMNLINNQAIGQSLDYDASMARTAAIDRQTTAAGEREVGRQKFRQDVEFPHEVKLRETVPGGTQAIIDAQGARQKAALTSEEQRSANYRAMGMVRLLHEQGLLSPTLPDGSPDPDYQRKVADANFFYSLDPEEQQAFLEEQSILEDEEAERQALEDERVFSEEVLPEMRRDAIGVLGQNPTVRKRLDLLEQEGGGRVRFEDIYGLPAQDVLGLPYEIPTPFLHAPDEQGNITRQNEKTGAFIPNMSPFEESLKFLNRQSKANIQERLKKLRGGGKPAVTARPTVPF